MMFDERAQRHQRHHYQKRLRIFGGVIALVFSLVILRFYHLQIISGLYYRGLSENNRLELIEINAPRGIIFDRHGQVLAGNRPSFKASLVLEDVYNLEETRSMLVKVLDLDEESFSKAIKKVKRYRQFEPVKIEEDVPRDRLAYLETVRFQYPGIKVDVEPRRYYPEGELAAHVLGHVGEISEGELERMAGRGYEVGDYIGKLGLEKEYNDLLKGLDGGLQVEVDSLGRQLRVLDSQKPLPGNNVVMTLDLGIQKAAEESLDGVTGAAVVMDPRDGSILAIVSHPSFNPNLFSGGISTESWKRLSMDDKYPMQNRAIQSQYPPGSVFKLVTAIAGLEEGIINENTTFYCGGGLQFGDRYYRCWKEEGHSGVNLHKAIVQSCDTYFYHLAEKLGIDAIARYARELGLGQRTGIGLPGEWSGLNPDNAWKKNAREEVWYPGETLISSIGQGFNLMTPIQMAVMISTIANGGHVYRPMIVKSILAADGKVVEQFTSKELRKTIIRPEIFRMIREGMKGVVNEPHGTGWMVRLGSAVVAGKTGTAQVIKLRQESEDEDQGDLPEKLRDHAWFTCFAPFENPEVVVVVMLEHGGHGGTAAGPLARKILQAIFEPSTGVSREVGFEGGV